MLMSWRRIPGLSRRRSCTRGRLTARSVAACGDGDRSGHRAQPTFSKNGLLIGSFLEHQSGMEHSNCTWSFGPRLWPIVGRNSLWHGPLITLNHRCDHCTYSYRAAGDSHTICRTDLVDPAMIFVSGMFYDTIEAVTVPFQRTLSSPIEEIIATIEAWERFAGGPWTGDNSDLTVKLLTILTCSRHRECVCVEIGEQSLQEMILAWCYH